MESLKIQDYRHCLKAELDRRKRINPSYSLRCMARDLDLNPGFLSMLLNGTGNLSPKRAVKVFQDLGYSPTQIQGILRLMQSQKYDLTEDGSSEIVTLNLDAFHVISDWYHYAILELTFCSDFCSEPAWIAERLKISSAEAEEALTRLIRLGLAKEENGVVTKNDTFLAIPTNQPSHAFRSFHAQMLEKAKDAIESIPVTLRDITGTTIAVDTARLPLVKEEIARFRQRIAELMDGANPDQVYQLAVQFFPLTMINHPL